MILYDRCGVWLRRWCNAYYITYRRFRISCRARHRMQTSAASRREVELVWLKCVCECECVYAVLSDKMTTRTNGHLVIHVPHALDDKTASPTWDEQRTMFAHIHSHSSRHHHHQHFAGKKSRPCRSGAQRPGAEAEDLQLVPADVRRLGENANGFPVPQTFGRQR